MPASAPMGRPKIEGLVSLNLRIVQQQLDGLDKLVDEQREARGDPALNRTDLIREAIAEYLAARTKKRGR